MKTFKQSKRETKIQLAGVVRVYAMNTSTKAGWKRPRAWYLTVPYSTKIKLLRRNMRVCTNCYREFDKGWLCGYEHGPYCSKECARVCFEYDNEKYRDDTPAVIQER